MTIVIPYKQEVHNGLELKYALRSIEKNLTGWDEIILLGQHPSGFDIPFAYYDDYPGRKEFSVYNKLMAACTCLKISEDFIYWNDDHFLLKPLGVSEIKYWHNGPLAQRLGHVYNRELLKTQMTLKYLQTVFEVNNYDVHTPIVFNKSHFKHIFKNLTEEICIKSYYANNTDLNGNSEFMEDCKIVGHFSKEEVRQKIAGRLFFSTNAICNETIEVLEELFPEKSRFEL